MNSSNFRLFWDHVHPSIPSAALALAHWANREQAAIIDYLREENRIIEAGDEAGKVVGDVRCRERLGGMLRYYHREAA